MFDEDEEENEPFKNVEEVPPTLVK